jgi:hypothetical protein
MHGRVEVARLRAELGGIVLPRGPKIDSFELSGEGIRLQTEPFSLELTQPAAVKAVVLQGALESMIRDEAPPMLKDIQVTCREGGIFVVARAKVVFEITVEAECVLEVVGGKELHVRLVSVSAPGPVKSALEGQLDRLNPVFSAADLPLKVELTRVEMMDGCIALHGHASP